MSDTKGRGISRREALAGAGALGTLVAVGALPRFSFAADPGSRRPPVARVEPVRETFFGRTVVDPYRWMENPKDPDWEPFMQAHAAHTRAVLDAIPGRQALAERIAKLSGDTALTRSVSPAGRRVFYEKRPAGAANFQLYVRDGLDGPERLLVDPTTMKQDGRHVSMDWWSPSPDGRHVALGLSPAGSELADASILEVDSGRWLPEKLARTPLAPSQWLPDGSGFFQMRLRPNATPGAVDFLQRASVWLHRLRTDPKDDLRVFGMDLHAEVPFAPEEFPFVSSDPSSGWVVGVTQGGVRRENPYFVAKLADVVAGRARWTRACTVEDEVTAVTFRGDELWMLTTKGAPNGRVVRVPLAAPAFAQATEVVPESAVVVEGIAAARDALYVQDMDGGYGALRRLGRDGKTTAVPLPFEGSVGPLVARGDEDGAWFGVTGWLQPLTQLRYDPATNRTSDTGLSPKPPIDTSPYEAIRAYATARDGTRVPVSIVARKGAKRDGRNPTLVNAYGSYQISYSPGFNARGFAFLEQGGVLAVAHVRGGGEYGRRWWKAGQKLSKPNTWRDLIDCCEHLVKEGWTSPARLAIQGGSAGGITVGGALTERPDLFAAVIANVPVTNNLRAEFTQNGPTNVDEFGSVKDADGFRGLVAMDSYQAVRDGTRYPAVLLTTGMTDLRVEPWMAAKMTARLLAATAPLAERANPVLLRVTFDAGHGIGSTRPQVDAERADEYAFVLWRTGAAGFQPAA